MDKELNNIADNIIKDNFGSAAPSADRPAMGGEPLTASGPTSPATPRETFTAETPRPAPSNLPPTPQAGTSRPIPPQRPLNPMASPNREPVTREPIPRAPAAPGSIAREPIAREPATPEPVARPPLNSEKTNEYNRIKEQMSAARETSNIPSPEFVANSPRPAQQGLNKGILLLIIFIPVIVVAIGVIIALLNQPSKTSDNSSSSSTTQPVYQDPKKTAGEIDLSVATEEIQITEPGYYILSGVTNFPVKVNAPGEVTLYLHNVSITATDASALSNFSTNPLVIFLDDDTESTLAVTDPNTFDSIFSEGDLTIDGGTGILNVTGIKIADGHNYDVTGNGIKDAKLLVITNPEDGTTVQPAEGESNFQGVTTPESTPAESTPATTPTEPTATSPSPAV